MVHRSFCKLPPFVVLFGVLGPTYLHLHGYEWHSCCVCIFTLVFQYFSSLNLLISENARDILFIFGESSICAWKCPRFLRLFYFSAQKSPSIFFTPRAIPRFECLQNLSTAQMYYRHFSISGVCHSLPPKHIRLSLQCYQLQRCIVCQYVSNAIML